MTIEDKKRIYKIAKYKKQQAEKDYAEKKQRAEQLDLNLFGNLKLIFGLTPEKALKWFQEKLPELSEHWYDLWENEHITSFTVAGVASMDLLLEIQKQLERALTEGITFAEFQESIEEKLDSAGWSSGEETLLPSRLTTIWRTNLKSAYSAGRWDSIQENKASRPFLQYRTLEDDSVRLEHAELDLRVFKADDVFFNSHYPPNGFSCRCFCVALAPRDIARKNLEIETGEGNMGEREVVLNKADDIRVKVTTYKDPKTGEEIGTDPGFSYNVGKKKFSPDLSTYPSKLKKEYKDYLNSSK
jgi:SPP1 gp7 family putative phage head morphogenesis protein